MSNSISTSTAGTTTAPTATGAPSTNTTATTAAATTSTPSTFTTATSIFIVATVTTPSTETSSSSDVNVGVIVAPIIIIIVIALVVVALIIAFYWWRRKKLLHSIYDEAVTLSAVNPYYTTAKPKEMGDATDGTHVIPENTYVNQQPLPVYAVPDKQKRKSVEVQRSIVDFDLGSSEMSVSQKQMLSSIIPDYENDMELHIYAAPDLPECTEATSIMFDCTDEDNPTMIYSEAINPAVIIDSTPNDSISDNDSFVPICFHLC